MTISLHELITYKIMSFGITVPALLQLKSCQDSLYHMSVYLAFTQNHMYIMKITISTNLANIKSLTFFHEKV